MNCYEIEAELRNWENSNESSEVLECNADPDVDETFSLTLMPSPLDNEANLTDEDDDNTDNPTGNIRRLPGQILEQPATLGKR